MPILLLPAALLAPPPPSLADLLVRPTRVVLEERAPATEVVLLNSGIRTATFQINLAFSRMDADGQITLRPPQGSEAASAPFVFSPAQVVLEPGSSQIIRLSLKHGKAFGWDRLPPEWRAHLQFRALPDTPAPEGTLPAGPLSPGAEARVQPVYGISIPVIVRRRTQPPRLTWSDLRLDTEGSRRILHAVLHREGDQSSCGTIEVRHQPREGAPWTRLLRLEQSSVYTEQSTRTYRLPLPPTTPGGTLQITYLHPDTNTPQAQATLPHP